MAREHNVLNVDVTDARRKSESFVLWMPEALDEEAVAAVAQWQFEPGRLGATPVNVRVRIMLDFVLR